MDPEDNDTQDTATDIDDLGCNDGPTSFDGSLEPGDPDWLTFDSVWDCGGPNPSVEASLDIDAGVCVFVDCTVGGKNPVVACDVGQFAFAPDGEPGCCGDGTVDLYVNCSGGGDESLAVWFLVDDGPAICTDYTLEYEVAVEP